MRKRKSINHLHESKILSKLGAKIKLLLACKMSIKYGIILVGHGEMGREGGRI